MRIYSGAGDGTLQAVAGSGSEGFNGDVRPAEFAYITPSQIRGDGTGILYFADPANNRVRMYVPSQARVLTTRSIVDSAGFRLGALSPGQLITLFAGPVGPEKIAVPFLLEDRPMILAGVEVLVDGQPAPLVYSERMHTGAVVPFSIAGKSSVRVSMRTPEGETTEVLMPVMDVSPTVFTLAETGTGQVAAEYYGQPKRRVTTTDPPMPGDVISVLANGLGLTDPPVKEGEITLPPLGQTVVPVTASINGVDAAVLYSGSVAFSYGGIYEVRVQVPDGVPREIPVPFLIQQGERTSQPGVTVVLR